MSFSHTFKFQSSYMRYKGMAYLINLKMMSVSFTVAVSNFAIQAYEMKFWFLYYESYYSTLTYSIIL